MPFGHAVEEVQVVKAKALKAGEVAVRDLEGLVGQFDLRQQVVVELGLVAGVHADRNGDVGQVPGRIKPEPPAAQTAFCGLMTSNDQADDQLVIEVQEIGIKGSVPFSRFE